jgi:hypothetical protein
MQYRSLRRLGGDLLLIQQEQNPTPSTKDEAPLNCVALRPSLDYEVAWRAVKGQDERQRTAHLPALHATGRSVVDVGEKNVEGRHVGLDFYDLLIEVLYGNTSIEQRPSFVEQFAHVRLAEDHSLFATSSLVPRLLRSLGVGFRQKSRCF